MQTITLTLTEEEARFLADISHEKACDWEYQASLEKDDLGKRQDWRAENELAATEKVAEKARSLSDKIKKEMS